MTLEDATLFTPRDRRSNLDLLGRLLCARDATEQQHAVADAQRNFHPSFLAECDYRVRFMSNEPWQAIAHQALMVYLFTLQQNAQARLPHPYADQAELIAAFNDYLAAVGGTQLTLTEHLEAARRFQSVALTSAPSCDDRWAHFTASVLHDVAGCTSGSKLAATVVAAVENATHLLLDAPATRLDALAFIFARRQLGEAGFTVEAERPGAVSAWLSEQRRATEGAGLGPLATLLSLMNAAIECCEESGFDGEWDGSLAHCARCSMIFASVTPLVLDQRCPTVNAGDEMIFLKRDLNRAKCMFCGLESYMEVPGFLYWQARNLLVYRLPFMSLGKDETMELCRPGIEQLRGKYLNRLSGVDREAFEQAVEVVAHGWREWLYAVHMGDVIPEDHVAIVVQSKNECERILLDSTKLFMRELQSDEYRDVDPATQEHIRRQMAALDPDKTEQIVQEIVKAVEAELGIDVDDELAGN
ncbi:hypothetical protein J2S43_003250 [Catenuloplanes nepalensis]|uniref:Uncharacterized protein n=1 Tax=Catenuloplanes nepalensis TaxID=587533 RepID=A0ABT9MTI4_9ACTN|nr:hypothetical protein [Catenuloplanes nepalensis]MDP9794738.1 hypothetical protein [Catenuloplanes nepalensis]